MAELRIRDVDPYIVEKLKKMAKRHGLTMEKQILALIIEKLNWNKQVFLDERRRDLEEQRRKYGVLPDSTPGIRAERDEM